MYKYKIYFCQESHSLAIEANITKTILESDDLGTGGEGGGEGGRFKFHQESPIQKENTVPGHFKVECRSFNKQTIR